MVGGVKQTMSNPKSEIDITGIPARSTDMVASASRRESKQQMSGRGLDWGVRQ
jgi:hypothetical protein